MYSVPEIIYQWFTVLSFPLSKKNIFLLVIVTIYLNIDKNIQNTVWSPDFSTNRQQVAMFRFHDWMQKSSACLAKWYFLSKSVVYKKKLFSLLHSNFLCVFMIFTTTVANKNKTKTIINHIDQICIKKGLIVTRNIVLVIGDYHYLLWFDIWPSSCAIKVSTILIKQH